MVTGVGILGNEDANVGRVCDVQSSTVIVVRHVSRVDRSPVTVEWYAALLARAQKVDVGEQQISSVRVLGH